MVISPAQSTIHTHRKLINRYLYLETESLGNQSQTQMVFGKKQCKKTPTKNTTWAFSLEFLFWGYAKKHASMQEIWIYLSCCCCCCCHSSSQALAYQLSSRTNYPRLFPLFCSGLWGWVAKLGKKRNNCWKKNSLFHLIGNFPKRQFFDVLRFGVGTALGRTPKQSSCTQTLPTLGWF